MPKSLRVAVLLLSLSMVITLFVGANARRVSAASSSDDGAYKQMQTYSEVLKHIQSDYVVDPNMPAVTTGAMRGLVESLDSSSSYLSPAEYKAYKAYKPAKGSIGAVVAKRFGYAIVISVVPDSPADKANLVDGDILEAIEGASSRDMSIETIQQKLAGEPGTDVKLEVVRPRKATPDQVTITRRLVAEPATVDSLYDSASILYLKPEVIDREHVQQVEQKVKSMNKLGTKKILLDLRDVSTGDNAEALRLANFFVKTGTLAMLEGQKVSKQTFAADPSKAINATAPMVTLVNRGTAGPAELVAGALQGNKRSELVGEKTFGSGTQLKTFDLPDGAAVILSIAKYETPEGKKWQDDGITPGTQVAIAADTEADSDEDEDDSASPSTPAVTGKPNALPAKPALKSDDQLNKALEILKSKSA